jgi:hypothetical protein
LKIINSANKAEEYDGDNILPPLFVDRTERSLTRQPKLEDEIIILSQSIRYSIHRVKNIIAHPIIMMITVMIVLLLPMMNC